MPNDALIFPSMVAAASASGVPLAILRAWKAGGIAGFDRSGRVDLKAVLAVVFASDHEAAPPLGMRSWRDALNKAQAERQQLRLDRERGEVVRIAWVIARFQAAGADINAIRIRSESEDALRFSETAGDVAECRIIVRRIWDEIMESLQVLAKHFEEGDPDEKVVTS